MSISTWLMLNSSTLSMINSGSLWGYLKPQLSLTKKTMLGSSLVGIFIERSRKWTLFISLPCAILKDFSILPTVCPLEIVFISPAGGLLSPTFRILSWSSFRWYLWGSVFLMYFCNFPYRIKVSSLSFKCLHSSVRCP